MTAKVRDAVVAFEAALEKLRTLDPEQPVNGNFDQGGYTDCSFPISHISFSISSPDAEEVKEMEEAGEKPYTSICANFYSVDSE